MEEKFFEKIGFPRAIGAAKSSLSFMEGGRGEPVGCGPPRETMVDFGVFFEEVKIWGSE